MPIPVLTKPIYEYVPLKSLNILRRFSILAFIPIILIVLLMSIVISHLVIKAEVKSETLQTKALTTILSERFLVKDDFNKETPVEKRNFESALTPILAEHSEYKRIKVYDSEGTVLWSDKKELVNINFYISNKDLRETLKGEVTSRFGTFLKGENIYEKEFGKGLEIYVPVFMDQNIVGAIEVYRVPKNLLKNIKYALFIIWSLAIFGGIFIYLSLYWLVKSSYTHQVSLEQNIRESKQRLEYLIDGLRDGVALIGPDCNILTINKTLAEKFNISLKDSIGKNVVKLIFSKAKERMFDACGETCIKKVASSFDFELEDKITKRISYIKVNCFPLTAGDDDREPGCNRNFHAVIVLREVTKEKELTDDLIRSEKLATIGTLFPKISHEIRSPLNALELGLMTLQEKYPDDNVIDLLTSTKEKLLRIANDLLAFSRVEEEQFTLVNVNSILKSSVKFLKDTTGQIKYHEIIEEYSDVPAIMGIPGRLEQLFVNLIINASHSMENLPLSKQVLQIGSYLESDDIVVFVKDSGTGIKKEDHDKIFDPFFTTKKEGKGTGLGMAIVNEIAKKHHAKISFESEPEIGSTFYITFPLLNEPESE